MFFRGIGGLSALRESEDFPERFGAMQNAVASTPSAPVSQSAPATDPYEAIRSLKFNPEYRWYYDSNETGPMDVQTSSMDEINQLIAQYAQGESQYGQGESQYGQGEITQAYSPDLDALRAAGFESKYGKGLQAVPGEENLFKAVLQNPGQHKYDTLDAYYRLDPETGMAQMVADPTESRQQSSSSRIGQGIGTVGAFLAGGALAGPLSSALGGGILGGAGAGAIIGGGGALAGGANREEALRGAVTGGVLGGVGGYFQGAEAGADLSDAAFEAMHPLPANAILTPSAAASAASSLPAAAGQTINITGALPSAGIGGLAGAVGAIPSPVAPRAPEVTQQLEVVGKKDPPNVGALAGISPPQNNTVPTVQDTNTIEVVGKKDPPKPQQDTSPLPLPPLTVTPPASLPVVPEMLEPMPQAPDEQKGPAGNGIMDFFNKNPRLALTLLSALAGKGGGGGGGNTGPGTAIDQTQLTANPAQKFQRQYVAPPPGYRPGFDPEHRYFTGIGTVGTGG